MSWNIPGAGKADRETRQRPNVAESRLSAMSSGSPLKGFGLLYVILSVLCSLSYWVPALHRFVEADVGLICFLGPPAWLLYGGYHYEAVFIYMLGTVLCLLCFAGAGFFDGGYERRICLIAGILTWLASGFMACAMAI